MGASCIPQKLSFLRYFFPHLGHILTKSLSSISLTNLECLEQKLLSGEYFFPQTGQTL